MKSVRVYAASVVNLLMLTTFGQRQRDIYEHTYYMAVSDCKVYAFLVIMLMHSDVRMC